MKTMHVREYNVNESVLFRKTKEEYGGLSNMAAGFSLNVNDVIIPTAEHLYQACRFPNYPDIQWDIINEKSPMKAKWIGRAKIGFTRPDWEYIKFKVMRWSIEVKLSQNWKSFSDLLLSTGNKHIVELTPKDKVWGAVRTGDVCIGVNALGRLLMEVREFYVKPNNYKRCVQPLDISDFNLLGSPIGLICNEDDLIEEDVTQQDLAFAF